MRGRNYKSRKKRGAANPLVVTLVAVLVVAVGGAIAFVTYQNAQEEKARQHQELVDQTVNADTLYAGIFIDDISMAGLTKEQARKQIEEGQQERVDTVGVKLTHETQEWSFVASDMAVHFDTEEIIEQAWTIGREGSVLERFDTIQKLPENPVRLSTTMTVDAAPLEARVRDVAASLTVPAVDATVESFNPGKEGEERFSFTLEKAGAQVNADQLWADVKQEIDTESYGTVAIETQPVPAQVTADILRQNTKLISTMTTTMKDDSNREENIRLSSDAISGTVLLPGEVFSFNDTTGERSEKKGYKVAGIINNGKTDNGLGGGVCQVSGTLFNAAVMADLEIVERTKHSYVLGYLDAGTDATVDFGRLDLKFRNNHKMPIYIVMHSSSRTHKVTAEIYGMPLPDGVSIKLKSVTTDTYKPGETKYVADSSVPKGTTKRYGSHTGYRVTTYKVYLKDGKEYNRVELHKDYYRPIAPSIHYNPADPNPGEPTPTPTPSPTPKPEPTDDGQGGDGGDDKPDDKPTDKPDDQDVVG